MLDLCPSQRKEQSLFRFFKLLLFFRSLDGPDNFRIEGGPVSFPTNKPEQNGRAVLTRRGYRFRPT